MVIIRLHTAEDIRKALELRLMSPNAGEVLAHEIKSTGRSARRESECCGLLLLRCVVKS